MITYKGDCMYKKSILLSLIILSILTGCSLQSQSAVSNQNMVTSPVDFASLNINLTEEDGISYYNIHTSKSTPLPLNEWGKMNLLSALDTPASVYIKFTSVTRDKDEISEYMKQYFLVKNIHTTFNPEPLQPNDEYVLMQYQIYTADDISTIHFPIQLYSTLQDGSFGEDTLQERENQVQDVSMEDTNSSTERAILCQLPESYTAYGICIPYYDANGYTQTLYFKLEY